MAVYRNIHISFWQDEFVLGLTPEEKYFYLYLMTNSKTNQAGCYSVARKIMEMETGYNRETVEKLIQKFKEYEKIDYCFDTKEILIKNWFKYSWTKSPKVISCIKKDIAGIKNLLFKDMLIHILTQYIEGVENIQYEYSIDTVSIPNHNKNNHNNNHNHKNNHNNNHNNILSENSDEISAHSEIIDYLNLKTGFKYRQSTPKTKQLINARLNEKFTVEDFKTVIDKKTKEWIDDPKFSAYLRPETLFGTKFESYLNQKEGNYGNNNSKGGSTQYNQPKSRGATVSERNERFNELLPTIVAIGDKHC